VEVLRTEVDAALTHVADADGGASGETDPWWQYHLGAGRDADALLAALRGSVR
jgi:hypothetical protein